MEFIAKITIRRNGQKYIPGDTIELTEKEAKSLPVCSKEEWERSQNPGAAVTTDAALKKENEELKKKLGKTIQERDAAKKEKETLEKEIEKLKKGGKK